MRRKPHPAQLLAATLAVLLVSGSSLPLPPVLAQSSDRTERESRDGDRGEEGRRSSWRDRFGGRSRDSRRESESGDSDRDRDRGGDSRSSRSDSERGSSLRSSSSSSGGSSSDGGMKLADYIRQVVAENDKNGNKMLEGEELKGLRGRAATADLDKDGVITIDELTTHLSASSSGSTSPTSSSSSSSRSTSARDESDDRRDDDRDRDRDRGRFSSWRRDRDRDSGRSSDERRSSESSSATKQRVYLGSTGGKTKGEGENDKEKAVRRTWRFSTPADRLPTGLPSWFKSRDDNNDGQVSMSEYSRTWSKRTVGEFRELDLNDDGVITPREAAAAKK